MEALRDMIWQLVEADAQKLASMEQLEAAMTGDTRAAGANKGSRGAGMGGAPGLKPLVEAELANIGTLLADSEAHR